MKQQHLANRPKLSARAVAMATALTVAFGMAQFTVAPTVAHAATSFYTSFETADPQPITGTFYSGTAAGGESVNVTGKAQNPGSLQSYINLSGLTACGQNTPNEGVAQGFDLDPGTKWLSFYGTSTNYCPSFPLWVNIPLTSPQKVATYAITSGNDSHERDPKNWTFLGSNDGATWTTLDTQTDQTWASYNLRRVYTIPSANQATYSYYRWEVSATGATSGAFFQIDDFEILDGTDNMPPGEPMGISVGTGPVSDGSIGLYRSGVGFTGARAMYFGGSVNGSGGGKASNLIFDNIDVTVQSDTELSFKIFPQTATSEMKQDGKYASGYVAVNIEYTDSTGTHLASTNPDIKDGSGIRLNPQDQGDYEMYYMYQWNSVKADLSSLAGATINKVLLSYQNDNAAVGESFSGWIDDLRIDSALNPYDPAVGLVSYTDTRRGSYASTSFSRGLNIPGTTTPHGFNFFAPMTATSQTSQFYSYMSSNTAGTDSCPNCTPFTGILVSHEPSYWMGDRNQLAIFPASATNASYTNASRRRYFKHSDEVARADYWGATFSDGVKAEVTPTDHGAAYRFTFASSSTQGWVMGDNPSTGSLTMSSAGVLTGYVQHGGDDGNGRLYVYGVFDRAVQATGSGTSRTSAKYARFDTSSDKDVELYLATSLMSTAQAQKNYELELQGKTFDQVHQEAIDTWNDVLSVIDVSQATNVSYVQKVRLYSNLYRLSMYPNMQHENTGTNANPVWKYASPVNSKVGSATSTVSNAVINNGKMFVNNGFWDTYRTAWPAYALLWPDMAAELVDGMVEMYRAGGWVSRWSSPGYSNLMTGTSSDASFAEAYIAGVLSTQQALDAWDAGVRNAMTLPTSDSVGRKGFSTSPFTGYTSTATGESVSWGLEGYINDYALAYMGEKLAADPQVALAVGTQAQKEIGETAAYFKQRAYNYVNTFDPVTGIFQGKSASGVFTQRDKTWWGSEFTETNGWNFAFHAPYDAAGLADLYGGYDGLIAELDEFFTTPEMAQSGGGYGGLIHEIREAKEVRMGQYGGSNQVSHHIPWMYAAAGKPSSTQELTREAVRRLYVGEDIGEGFPGDEDNGEMSAWGIFASLGFYPLSLASGGYTIGSPVFDKAVIHRSTGDITISAPGNSEYKQYVSGVKIDNLTLDEAVLPQKYILSGNHTVTFTMSETPDDSWVDPVTAVKRIPLFDMSKYGSVDSSDGTLLGSLTDDNSNSSVQFSSQNPVITWAGDGPATVTMYTITNAGTYAWPNVGDPKAPKDWTLYGSNDGTLWTTLDTRSNETFYSATETRVFSIASPQTFLRYKLEVTATNGDNLKLAEFELLDDAELGSSSGLVLYTTNQKTVVDKTLTAQIATLTGGSDDPADYVAEIDFLDGTGYHTATVTTAARGVQITSPAHSWPDPATYSMVLHIEYTGGGEVEHARGVINVVVGGLPTFEESFELPCLGEIGQGVNCDMTGMSLPLSDLAADRTGGLVEPGTTNPVGYVPGTTVQATVAGTPMLFELPAKANITDNDNVVTDGTKFVINVPPTATVISFVGFATEGNTYGGTGTMTYSDGSTKSVVVWFNDWCQGLRTAAPAEYTFAQSTTRLSGNNRESGNCANPKLRVSTPQDITAPNPGAYPVTFTMPNIGTMISSGGKIPHSHVFALGYDVAPVPPVTMSLTAETVPDQSTYVSTGTLPLATFAGDTPTTATINWGDATPVDKVNVTGSTIDGTHVYTIPGDYTAIVTATNGLRTAAVNVSIHVDETIFTPVVTATPSSVGWGDTVTVSGTGFASGATITVDFGASTPNTTTYTADASGEFTAAFTVDYGIPSSTYPVSAIGSISNVMTSANVVVTAPDTTALQRLISEAQALDSEDFSVETWTPLAAELADAIATLADPQLTQAKVDAAVGQLQGALDDLVSIADLRDLLSTVYHTDTHTHALNPNDYTSSTWDDLVSAITRAEAELLKATHAAGGPTQADVDDAYAELSAAIAGLVLKGDPDALANLVAAAQAIAATGDYEPSQALDDWIATAQTAVANAADYSQRELDAIYLQLTDAMISLVPVAPTTTELRDLISSVGAALDPADYTAETAQAYTDALAAAQAVDADVRAGNIPSNDPAVSAALADLQDAIAQLVPAGYVPYTPPVVTKADLNTAVQAAVASPKDPAAYTPATYALYEAALADAQQVFNDPAATQAQVDAAYAALVQAITNLAPEEPVTQAVPPTTEYVPVPISTSLVKFAQKSVVLVKGKTFKVPVGIYYTSGATPSYRGWDVTWKSSNTKVATVREDGQITAKKAGTATITATAKKGTVTKTSVASIKVTVVKKKSAKKVSKITATVPKTMNVGQTVYLDAKYTSAKATQVKIKYSTKEFSIVGVDKAGRLTASKKGTDTLIIKAGKYTAKYKITVK